MWYPLYKLFLPCGRVLELYPTRVKGVPRGTMVINHVDEFASSLPKQKPPRMGDKELREDW